MPASRRPIPIACALLLAALSLGTTHARSAEPATSAPAAGSTAQPVDDSLRIVRPDSMIAAERKFNVQRLLAEADSMLKLRGGVHAEDAQLFLSWNAPWGQRRARTALTPRCDDTTAVDTLYLSFLPGRTSQGFNGFTSRLTFHSASADTLGPWWHMESRGGENGGNLLVEFGPSPDMPGPQPWNVSGQAVSQLKRTPRDVDLTLLFAVNHLMARPIVADTIYTLCRVLVRHRRATRLSGCGQPVCIEWSRATMAFAIKDEPEVRRGERFVTYGAEGTSCREWRDSRTQPWKPKVVR